MMSRHLFYRSMREDLRHKVWMIVLSALVSFLAVPVVWLVMRSNMPVNWEVIDSAFNNDVEQMEYAVKKLLNFYNGYLIWMGSFFAISAALLSGLYGFRYVLHKNMVDLYHSLPVKRNMLYRVCYLNGILVWAAPYLLNILLTLMLMSGLMGRVGGSAAVAKMLGQAMLSFLAVLLIFLLVYHTVLLALMLSGNILNTLTSMLILGFGVISVLGMWVSYLQYYMSTYYYVDNFSNIAIYSSPLFAAIYLGFSIMEFPADTGWLLLMNGGVAAVTGCLSWLVYQRRSSELAEQGVRNKVVTAFLRGITGVLAGMGGWIFFVLVTDNMGGLLGLAWKSFGAILLSVLVFGGLDVIFHMDFKAFFNHRLQMAGVVGLSLLICCAFYRDWFGYDEYLPSKSEIAELAVYDGAFSNRYGSRLSSAEAALENMHYRDVDTIYDYLEHATGRGGSEGEGIQGDEGIYTKVTLKSGRSYYRFYCVPADKNLLWPLFTSQEYLEQAYLIDDVSAADGINITFTREGESVSVREVKDAQAIVQAYNQDLMEHTDEVLFLNKRLLVRMRLGWMNRNSDGERWMSYTVIVNTAMEHTIEALRKAGYGKWVEEPDVSEISAIELGLHSNHGLITSPEDIMTTARKLYGVELDKDFAQGEVRTSEAAEYVGSVDDTNDEKKMVLQITNRAEIEELFEHISYTSCGENIFIKGYVKITLVDNSGNIRECYYQKGNLPMKYIQRFAQLAESDV